jgi:hypothetical protein
MNAGAKGLNYFASDQFVGDNEGSAGMNMTIVETGAVAKVTGWEEVGTGLTNPPRGMASYYPRGLDPMLLTIDGPTMKYLHGNTWDSIAGAIFGDSSRYDFVQADGTLYVHNSVDASTRLNGSTLDRPTTTVRAAFGVFYANRQIVSGVRLQPNRLYISSSADKADFTNTGQDSSSHPGATTFGGTDAAYIDIARDDGDKITGLAKYGDDLIIFKERSIYSLIFDPAGLPIVKLVTNAMGCVSHWSIDQVDNDIIFLSRLGFYVLGTEPNYFDQVRTNELSVRIKPLVGAIAEPNLDRATGIWHDNVYFCAVPVGAVETNNRCFTYHRQYTGWEQRNDMHANAFTEFIGADNREFLYYADDAQPKVWRSNNTHNHGDDPIEAYWISKATDLGAFDLMKRFIDLTLLFRQLSGRVKVTVWVDGKRLPKTFNIPGSGFSGGLGRAVLGKSLLGGRDETLTTQTTIDTTNVPIRLRIGAQGRTIKFKLENGNKGENFVFIGYDVGYRARGRNNFPSELRVY